MDINNQFEVPLAPSDAWALLLDIERIVPCVPGAELVKTIDPRTYKGKVAVKLGPIALSFIGTAQFVERDDIAHRAKVKAKGSDAKGRGGADAEITFRIEPVPEGSRVLVETNVNLSGSIAQYGRGAGVIQGVASQLTSQFASNLRASLANASIDPKEVPVPNNHDASRAGVASQAATAISTRVPVRTSTEVRSPVGTPQPAAKPISGLSLIGKVVWNIIVGFFTRRKT